MDFKENKNSLKDNLKNIITELGTKDYYEIQSIGVGYTDKYNRATNAHEQGHFDGPPDKGSGGAPVSGSGAGHNRKIHACGEQKRKEARGAAAGRFHFLRGLR